jgi:hypothetical protein
MENKIFAKSIPKNTKVLAKEIKEQMKLSKKKRKKKKKKKITTKQPQPPRPDEDEDEDEDYDNRIKNFLICNKIQPIHRQPINLGETLRGEIMIVPKNGEIEIKCEKIVTSPLNSGEMFLGVLFESRKRKREESQKGPVQKKRKLKEVKIIKQKEQNPLKDELDNLLNIVILRRCINFFSYKKSVVRKKFLENITSKSQAFDNYIARVMILIPESSKLKYGILFYDDARFAEYAKNNILCKKKELKDWKRRVMTNNPLSVKKEFNHFKILRDEAKKRLMVRIKNLHKDFEDLLKIENLYIL